MIIEIAFLSFLAESRSGSSSLDGEGHGGGSKQRSNYTDFKLKIARNFAAFGGGGGDEGKTDK